MTNLNKKASLFLLLSFVTLFTNGQSWIWQRPTPQGNHLNDAFLLNQNDGWAVGSHGTVIKTTDGGLTWNVLKNNINTNLMSVYFTDGNNGIIVGDDKIYRTTNGGVDWMEVYNPSNQGLFDVIFVNATTGWAGGNYGALMKTTNGGASWSVVQTNTTNSIQRIYFTNENEGIVTLFSNSLMKTSDGGNNWEIKATRSNMVLCSEFIDMQTGWISFDNGNLLKTTDGGNYWSYIYGFPNLRAVGLHFSDAQHGMAFFDSGGIGITNDGGTTWSFSYPSYALGNYLAFNGNKGIAVGFNGGIMISNDAGKNWQPIVATNVKSSFYAIDFKDNKNGWAVGYSIFKTTNGGDNWIESNNSGINNFNDICLTPQHNIFVAGAKGKILKSTDAGNSWSTLITNITNELFGIFFINDNIGWSVGANGKILKTINGGTTWSPQNSGTNEYLSKVKFINENIGWAVGASDKVLKTIDGGENWIPENTETSGEYFYNLFIKDESTIFVVGFTTILKSTNGGANWIKPISDSPYFYLRNIYFWDNNNGMTVGNNAFYQTTDGGDTWTKQDLKIDGDYWAIKFTDASHGWIANSNASILKYWNGQILISQENVSICPNTSITLSIEDCPGTVTWSNGMTGNSISFIPLAGVYTANCSSGGSKSCTIAIAENSLTVNETLSSVTKDFQAVNYVQSQSQIGNNTSDDQTKVKFYAGKSIILGTGFNANKYSTFTAEIKSCTN